MDNAVLIILLLLLLGNLGVSIATLVKQNKQQEKFSGSSMNDFSGSSMNDLKHSFSKNMNIIGGNDGNDMSSMMSSS